MKDTPAKRYWQQRRMGVTEELARAVVASSYGLQTNVVRLTSDGQEKVVEIPWTIRDIERLLFIQHLYRTGRLSDSLTPSSPESSSSAGSPGQSPS